MQSISRGKAKPRFRRNRQIKIAGRNFYLEIELDVKQTNNQGREHSRHNRNGHVHKELRHRRILLSGDLPY
jgi:hypothetical protein